MFLQALVFVLVAIPAISSSKLNYIKGQYVLQRIDDPDISVTSPSQRFPLNFSTTPNPSRNFYSSPY